MTSTNADELAETVLQGTEIRKLYLKDLGVAETRGEILSSFDRGASLMSYLGHGGIHLWADENLLSIDQVASLSPQSQQPLLLTMNCLNGYFHFPYFDSMAERLLKAEGRGAIAAFSPTGLSLNAPLPQGAIAGDLPGWTRAVGRCRSGRAVGLRRHRSLSQAPFDISLARRSGPPPEMTGLG